MKKIIGVTALAVSLFVSPHVSEAANKAFQDVPTTHSSYEAIIWTADQGIVSGNIGSSTPAPGYSSVKIGSFVHTPDSKLTSYGSGSGMA